MFKLFKRKEQKNTNKEEKVEFYKIDNEVLEDIDKLNVIEDEEELGEKIDKICDNLGIDISNIDDFLEGKTDKLKI